MQRHHANLASNHMRFFEISFFVFLTPAQQVGEIEIYSTWNVIDWMEEGKSEVYKNIMKIHGVKRNDHGTGFLLEMLKEPLQIFDTVTLPSILTII